MKAIFTLSVFFFFINSATAQPVIESLSPAAAQVGSSVTITGHNFNSTAANNIVYFGPVKATVTAASPNTLTVTVPSGATNSRVSVLNTATHSTGFSAQVFAPVFDGGGAITSNSFKAAINISSSSAPWAPRSLAVGDMDGDGRPDIVMISRSDASLSSTNTISLFRNTSTDGTLTTASFATPVDFSIPKTYGAFYVALGDLDNDGRLDVAIANLYANYITVFRNTATPGSLTTASLAPGISVSTGDGSACVAIADLDLDGRADLVASNSNQGYHNSVSVMRNTSAPGNISFQPPVKFTTGRGNSFVAVGDLDGDGKPDLATANGDDNSISLLHNTATPNSLTAGSFAPAVDLAMSPSGPWSVSIVDLDGDGKPDVIGSNGYVFKNKATPGSLGEASFEVPVQAGVGGAQLATGDLNGDGKPDLISVSTYGSLSVVQNNSTPGSITASSFGAPVELTIGFAPRQAVAADFDGDGRPDLAAANTGFSGINQSLGILQNAATPPLPGKIVLSSPALKLHTGDSATITATRYNADGTLASPQPPFAWTSDNSQNATVSNGVIKAERLGTTYVRVSSPSHDSAFLPVSVLADSVSISTDPANIVYNSLLLSLKTGEQKQLPSYLITDEKGTVLQTTPVFQLDDPQAASFNGNTVTAGSKPSVYTLEAAVNGKRLIGELTVFVYGNAATVKADTVYKFSVAKYPAGFGRYNTEAEPIVLDVNRIITPPHANGAFVLPVLEQYTDHPDSITVKNSNIMTVSSAGNLRSKSPGSTLVTVWYKNKTEMFKSYVAFDFSGNWRGKDKNGKNYSLCFREITPVSYSANTHTPDIVATGRGPVSLEAFPNCTSHYTQIDFRDTLFDLNSPPRIARIYTQLKSPVYGTPAEPIFDALWTGDVDHFDAVDGTFSGVTPNYPPFGTIHFSRGSDCVNLEKVLAGGGERVWYPINKPSSLDETGLPVTFYKNKTVKYYDSTANGVAPFYAKWSVDSVNNYLIFDFNSSADNPDLDTVAVYAYSDTLIVFDSVLHDAIGISLRWTTTCYYNCPQTLPLQWLAFAAQRQGEAVRLTWQTAQETNTDHFVVQRSTDGRRFINIGIVQAMGQRNEKTDYSFKDEAAVQQGIADVYYRLQSVDRDGTGSFSGTRIVHWDIDGRFIVFPNPAKTTVTVKGADLMEIILRDGAGKTVMEKTANGNTTVIDVSRLPKGLYLLQLKSRAGGVETKKLVVE